MVTLEPPRHSGPRRDAWHKPDNRGFSLGATCSGVLTWWEQVWDFGEFAEMVGSLMHRIRIGTWRDSQRSTVEHRTRRIPDPDDPQSNTD